MQKILLIGNGAREHAITKALKNSGEEISLFSFISAINPGIKNLSKEYKLGSATDCESIVKYAKEKKIDFAVVGPEAPLAAGVVDALAQVNIPAVGPKKDLAQLESSKGFTRKLLAEYNIDVNPKFKFFESYDGVEEFVTELDNQFVIKPDGLTGGKGVQVIGDHFKTREEGLEIIKDLIGRDEKLVIEEKFVGQEFSLMSYCDGENLLHMPAVQDHKRVGVGDTGPNTGGMGAYSVADFSLPFLDNGDIEFARNINKQVAVALKSKFGIGYKGILYGNFIKTKNGLKIIEYNARLGDPEAMNVLSLFKPESNCNLLNICKGIVNGNLNEVKLDFKQVATVCKYVVPEGYPDNPLNDGILDVEDVDESKVSIYYAAVDEQVDGIHITGSRAAALVGVHEDVYEAEKIVETEMKKIGGPVIYRVDIGTQELIEKKVKMMNNIMK